MPLVAYNLYKALVAYADITLATHVRNRAALQDALGATCKILYIDNERLAAPLYRAAHLLTLGRGGWTIRQAAMWLPYLYFERLLFRQVAPLIARGDFDLIHRLTPLTPTFPSPIASWTDVPFVLGPINGGLPWPKGTTARRWGELEVLSYFRSVYRFLPYVASTPRDFTRMAACRHRESIHFGSCSSAASCRARGWI